MFLLRFHSGFALALAVAALSAGYTRVCHAQATPAVRQNASDAQRTERARLLDSGKKAYQAGDYVKAEALLSQGLQLAETTGAKAWQADFLNMLGLVCYNRGQPQSALEYYRRALPLYRDYVSSDAKVLLVMKASAASVLNNMGNAADGAGLIQESLEYKRQALAIREQLGNKGKIADSLNVLGIAYEHLNQFGKALDYYGRALTQYEALQDQQGVQYACGNLANVYESLGEYDKALSLQRRALDIATASGDKSGIASSLNNLAITYQDQGQFDQALDLFHQALQIKQTLGNPQDTAITLHNLGGILSDKGLYDQALDNLIQALELRKQVGNPQEVAETLNSIGSIYIKLGRFGDAQKLHKQARSVAETVGDKTMLANSYVNLANIAANQGRYNDAFALENQALALYLKLASPADVAQCRSNLGAMHDMRGQADDYDQALIWYNQALPDVEAAQNPRALAMLLDNFGGVYQHKKNYERAASYHRRALELRRKIGNVQDVVISLSNLGGTYQNLNRLDEAEACFNEAAQAFEKVGEQVGDPSQYGAYQQTISNFYAHYADLKLMHQRGMEALVTTERGRARGIVLQAAQNAAALDSRLRLDERVKKQDLEQNLTQAGSRLTRIQQSSSSGDPEEEKARQNRLRTAQRNFEVARSDWQTWRDAFYARNPEYRRISGQSPPDNTALTALARQHSDTLYLEWQIVDDNEMLLFALSQAGLKTFKLTVRITDLEKQINAWRAAIVESRNEKPGKTGRQTDEESKATALYQALFGNIKRAGLLRPEYCKRLVIVGDGVLLRLPFAALVTPDGKRLVQHYALSSAISLGSLIWPTTARPANRSLLCIADPLGGDVRVVSRSRGTFGALEGARKEGEVIKALLPTTKLLPGSQAQKALVQQEMPKYAMLHFATHGSLDAAYPLHSALILAPEPGSNGESGILEAREIAGMHLSAQLAVLSACQTAEGQASGGDGLIGLTWAFYAAGCPSIVATQWEINDTATAVLMRAFYSALIAGKQKDDALCMAMQTVMRDKTRCSPYYWAAFQLVGNTDPMRLPPFAQQKTQQP